MVPYHSRKALRNLREGVEKMEGKLTVADKVYRAFRAGRPFKKDRLMFPADALTEVVKMRNKLCEALYAADLDPQDCRAAIVFQVANDEPPQVCVVQLGEEDSVLKQMLGRFQAVTVGALFALKDHERGITRRWAHPFLTSPASLEMLERALDSQEMKNALN
jgi:hypothetical protein